MIALIDYGAGNLQSVIKAFHYIGCEVKVTADPKELQRADAAVLPGVGAFGDAMNSLQKSGMVPEIYHFIEQNKPFLGIWDFKCCLKAAKKVRGLRDWESFREKFFEFQMGQVLRFRILVGIV